MSRVRSLPGGLAGLTAGSNPSCLVGWVDLLAGWLIDVFQISRHFSPFHPFPPPLPPFALPPSTFALPPSPCPLAPSSFLPPSQLRPIHSFPPSWPPPLLHLQTRHPNYITRSYDDPLAPNIVTTDAILRDPSIKGKVKESARAYIDGTNMVKKYQVCILV